MGLTTAQLKGKIKSIATKKGADPRTLMRIYMMERFLESVYGGLQFKSYIL